MRVQQRVWNLILVSLQLARAAKKERAHNEVLRSCKGAGRGAGCPRRSLRSSTCYTRSSRSRERERERSEGKESLNLEAWLPQTQIQCPPERANLALLATFTSNQPRQLGFISKGVSELRIQLHYSYTCQLARRGWQRLQEAVPDRLALGSSLTQFPAAQHDQEAVAPVRTTT